MKSPRSDRLCGTINKEFSLRAFFQSHGYWKSNPKISVWELGKKARNTAKEAVEVLLCQCVNEPSCDRHPLRVRENAAFLVNVDSYNNWEDIKDDMNGAYTKFLRCGI